MITSRDKSAVSVRAVGVRFADDVLHVALDDGREVSVSMRQVDWLGWLQRATLSQRNHWSIEPGGFAVYWPDLDDGIEVCHLLSTQSLTENSELRRSAVK